MQPTDKEYVAVMAAKAKAEVWFRGYGTSVMVKAKKIQCAWRLYVAIDGLLRPLESWPRHFDGYTCHPFVDGRPLRL